jgi:hypothetical protein
VKIILLIIETFLLNNRKTIKNKNDMKKMILFLALALTLSNILFANTNNTSSEKKEFIISESLRLVNGGDYIEVITNDIAIANAFYGEKEVLFYSSQIGKGGKEYVFIISKSNKHYLIKKLNLQ